jgi:TolB protein
MGSMSNTGRCLRTVVGCVLVLVALGCSDAPSPTAPSEPKSGAIAFTSDRDGTEQIYVMNADGSNSRRLTNGPVNNSNAAWSPDGKMIAFARSGDGNVEIYVMQADGSNPHGLVGGYQPAWSPDGKRIAFTIGGPGLNDDSYVYTVNAEGTGGTYIAGDYWPYEAASDPAWSPDGTRLALRLREFWDEGGYYTSIVVMNADGTNWRYVATSSDDGGGTVASPAWSPDGTKITFISYDRVSVVEADGLGEHALNTGTVNNESSVWSPDGTKIAFSGACVDACSGALDIFVMNADGSGVVRLTDHAGRNYAPVWRP